ncbi:MAG: O-antigen ligase family protein [Pseudoxanthomonas sp.]
MLAFLAMTDLGGHLKPEQGAMLATLLILPVWRIAWSELRRQPVVRWLAVLVAFVVAHAAYAAGVFPALGFSKQLSAAAEPVRLAAFSCVVGWWLSLMPRKMPVLFALMIAGLLLAVGIYMPWQDLPQIWDGRIRPRFGMPENLGGLLAALSGWLALCLALRPWNAHGRFGRRHGRIALCLAAYACSFAALLFSQSRGAWLAFAATLPVAGAGLWYGCRHGRAAVPWLPLACVAALSLLVLAGASDIVARRLAGAQELLFDTSAAVADTAAVGPPTRDVGSAVPAAGPAKPGPADVAESGEGRVNNEAIGVRVTLYRFGLQRWRERPWLGWGLGTTPRLIAAAGLALDGQRHAHLHNAYLDALVGLGLVGALLLGGFALLAVRELWLAWRSGVVAPPVAFALLAGSLLIVAVANGFDSLVWRYDYTRALLEILLGCCIAYGLIRRRERR